MENKKNKHELIKEAQEFADKLEAKKLVIKTAIDDLDEKVVNDGVSTKHLAGMAIIEELFVEYEELELEQLKVIEKIKKS